MKKNAYTLFVCVLLFLVPVVLSAQTVTFESVCTSLAAHPITTGNFTQVKQIASAKRSLKSSGTFIFSLDGIMWKTLKPFASTLVVGKTSVIQTTPDGKKTVIDASNNQIFTSISSTLSSIFSGDTGTLQKNFKVTFAADGTAWKAVLVPNDKTITAVMTSLTLGGNTAAGKSSLDSIIMKEASGDSITYTFTDQKYPGALTNEERAEFTAK